MIFSKTYGQLEIRVGISDSTLIRDLNPNTRDSLPPHMTSIQRTEIELPAKGLLVFQTDAPIGYYYYNGINWVSLMNRNVEDCYFCPCFDYDSNAYPIFTIGEQVWMAENLRVTHYRNGDYIPNVKDKSLWISQNEGARCYYENDSAINNPLYGALYNWYTINDNRGLCPKGWHVPTQAEWIILRTYLGGTEAAGGKMKSYSDLWNLNTGTTNASRFSGIPGGGRNNYGDFYSKGQYGHWWSSNSISEIGARIFWLSFSQPALNQNSSNKINGYSIRCIKD